MKPHPEADLDEFEDDDDRPVVEFDEDETIHVVPLDDHTEHTCSRDCWCGPEQDDEEPAVWIHRRGRPERGDLH